MGVGKRVQMMLEKDGGVQKGVRCPGVNQSRDGVTPRMRSRGIDYEKALNTHRDSEWDEE